MNDLDEQPARTGDQDLALTLMTMWALWSGRSLPEAPVALLSEEQLIDFWGE